MRRFPGFTGHQSRLFSEAYLTPSVVHWSSVHASPVRCEFANTMMMVTMRMMVMVNGALGSDSGLASHVYSLSPKQLVTWMFQACPQLPLEGLALTSN